MPTPAHGDHQQHVLGPDYPELSPESLSTFCLLFIMEKQMLISAVLRYFRMVFLLLLVNCSCPLVGSASNALHKLGDFTYPYSSIFSPLLKALSEHGGSRWNQELKKKIKPDHRYIKYLTEVYSKSSRLQRSLDGNKIYNTLRLIKPKDECQAKSYEGEQVKQLN